MARVQHLLANDTTAAIETLACCLSSGKAEEVRSMWAAHKDALRKGIVALETGSHEPEGTEALLGRMCSVMESVLLGIQ